MGVSLPGNRGSRPAGFLSPMVRKAQALAGLATLASGLGFQGLMAQQAPVQLPQPTPPAGQTSDPGTPAASDDSQASSVVAPTTQEVARFSAGGKFSFGTGQLFTANRKIISVGGFIPEGQPGHDTSWRLVTSGALSGAIEGVKALHGSPHVSLWFFHDGRDHQVHEVDLTVGFTPDSFKAGPGTIFSNVDVVIYFYPHGSVLAWKPQTPTSGFNTPDKMMAATGGYQLGFVKLDLTAMRKFGDPYDGGWDSPRSHRARHQGGFKNHPPGFRDGHGQAVWLLRPPF
jgi:hypothetical protein